jgi:hypothetical protein
MRFISNFRNTAVFLVVSMLLFTACHRQSSNNPGLSADDNGGYASDASRIEFANDDAISLADVAGTTFNGADMRTSRTTYIGNCAIVGVDSVSTPGMTTVSIYFGDTDCVCQDGRKRKGNIYITYSGHYTDAGQLHVITFSNYNVNDNQLSGSITTMRVDTTVTGDWYYKVQVNDTLNVSQYPLNSQMTAEEANLERKWVSGYASSDRTLGVFSISGIATLTRGNGDAFTLNIATPLQIALNCNFIESGVIDVSSVAGSRTLDYGTGACDQYANLYIGVNTYQIGLVQ